jgi:hypothetical protein
VGFAGYALLSLLGERENRLLNTIAIGNI